MEEIASLVIRVRSEDVNEARRRLDGLGKTSVQTQKLTDGVTASFLRMVGPLLSVGTALAGVNKLKNTVVVFENLEAQLKTATGSAENAAVAFEALKDFATTTPYALEQSVEAFIRLTNLGLTPSERALKAYGNTASAMGKDLIDMANAVGRAVAGEYEPLKSFGVQVRKESDGLAVSFRGTTEKIKNDAKSIEEYFIRLGERNFTGAMQERMKTLGGAISNLGDAWDQMFAQIGKAGAGDLMGDIVRSATSAVENFTAAIASGQVEATIQGLITKFSTLYDSVVEQFYDMGSIFSGLVPSLTGPVGIALDWVLDAFKNMPENVAVLVKAMGANWGLLRDYAKAGAIAVIDIFKAYWGLLIEATKNATTTMGELLKDPLDAQGIMIRYFVKQATTVKEVGTQASQAYDKAIASITTANKDWEKSIVNAMDKRDESIAKSEKELELARKRREEFEKERKIMKALTEFFGDDRLARFAVQGTSGPNLSEQQKNEFESLRDSLGLQESAIERSYVKRSQVIRDNTEKDSALQLELMQQLNDQVQMEYAEAAAKRYSTVQSLQQAVFEAQAQGRLVELESLQMQLEREQEMIRLGNEYRRNLILNDATLTAEEKSKRILEIERRTAEQLKALDAATNARRLQLASDFFGNMSSAAGAFGKKGAKIAQAAAIAQTTIKTYESATSAYASLAGIPYVGPALGAAAAAAAIAAGMANIAAIRSTNYQGNYEYGGMVSAGKFGIAGETGVPEIVRGPAQITSARQSASTLARGQQSGGNTYVNIVNQSDGQVEVTERPTEDGKVVEVLIRKVTREIASGIRTGASEVSKSLESTYSLRRGSAA